MHVYTCIQVLPKSMYVCVCICMYTYCNVFIWCICMYYVCICMYFLKWHPWTREPMPLPLNTFSGGGSRLAALRAPLGIWASSFFSPLLSLCRLYLTLPTTLHVSTATGADLSFVTEVSHARSVHYNPVAWPVTAGLVCCHPSKGPRASAAPPEKHLLIVIW